MELNFRGKIIRLAKPNKLFILLFVVIFVFQANAQQWNEIIKLVASDRDSVDWFGISVGISGNYAIVGASNEDDDDEIRASYENTGSAYIYEKDEFGHWIQKQKLKASDRDDNDYFAWSVAISGNIAVVGAAYEDDDVLGADSLNNSGSAYVFERDSLGIWNEVQKIVASDREALDNFGYSVDISGNYLIATAVWEDEDENFTNTVNKAGSAYIFERNVLGNWTQVQKIVASDRATDDRFGYTARINNEEIIVGAIGEDHNEYGTAMKPFAGSAYIFKRDSLGEWSQTQKIVASDRGVGDYFGFSVDIFENQLVVGAYHENENSNGGNTLNNAGSAYVFAKDSLGIWTEKQKITAAVRAENDLFGYSVSISENFIVVGAKEEDENASEQDYLEDAGAAYIFKENASGIWNQQKKIVNSDRSVNDAFASAIDISGNVVLAGAYLEDEDFGGANSLNSSGSAYIFDLCATIEYVSQTICGGDSVFLEGDFQTDAGEYYNKYVNINGCDSIVVVDLIVNPSYEFFQSVSICEGDSALIGGTYQTVSGTYAETFYTSLSCDSIFYTELNVNPLPIISYVIFPDSNNLGFIDLTVSEGSSPYFFNWSNGETSEDISQLLPGEYTITVSNAFACTAVELIIVPVYDLVQEQNIQNIAIQPNPNKGLFSIENVLNSKIYIYNVLGELIETSFSDKKIKTINISNQKNGIYFIKIVNNNVIYNTKI